MLQLIGINKEYRAGEMRVQALQDVSITFSRGEFVAVLGPSGCGKTTMLNIIGGLDRYDSGDLVVSGRSTKDFSERDMDAYRNHAVGFVFQSYNLIAHQSVLANVELALTLSGVSPRERRQKAKDALTKVGLADQLNKRPSQLSGGQMQRVAIARALVNDPDILLADEPTGALDSQTSIQVLDTLKELAKDRLVMMVTHNRELAQQYATRIVELKDGRVVLDSKPEGQTTTPARAGEPLQKTSMGFKTALALSFNNLLTKRGRTLITAFAGSIGIIGIALILAMSTGVSNYIVNIQKETMASYPITIQEETVQMGEIAQAFRQAHQDEADHPLDAVYINRQAERSMTSFQASLAKNNLTAFKTHLEAQDSPFIPYLTDIRYGYQADFDVFVTDPNGELVQVNGGGFSQRIPQAFASMMPFSSSVLTELSLADEKGLVGDGVKDSYTLLSGRWPQEASEVVLILDEKNELDDITLYQLGILPQEDLRSLMQGKALPGGELTQISYEALLGKKFSLLAAGDTYVLAGDGQYRNVSKDYTALNSLMGQAPQLTLVGILRQGSQQPGFVQGGLGYTRALTDLVIKRTQDSQVVKAQQASQDKDVVTGLLFSPENNQQKAANTKRYIQGLTAAQKAEFARQAYSLIPELSPGEGEDGAAGAQLPGGTNIGSMMAMLEAFTGAGNQQTGEEASPGASAMPGGLSQFGNMGDMVSGMMGSMADEQLANLLDNYLQNANEDTLANLYDQLISTQVGNYQNSLHRLGVVNLDTPSSISLYTDTFENKEHITRLIAQYNETAQEADRIVYTDYVALMISSVTTIINVISYVLIAFVAVSLVVSSIMIGIITYISVLERTKEIGILRAVGASRKDVARVFTAEAFIIGLTAGIMGILISFLLTFPINAIIHALTKDSSVNATLPLMGSLVLIAISALLSLLSGWIPSRVAARKDPVECLRAE